MKRLLFLFCVLLGSIAMFAQHRSEQEAIQIAQEFFNPRPAAHATRLVAVPQAQVQARISRHMARANQPSAQNSACYIINDEANNRFVIVSADERMYEILGYSDNGIFNAEMAPEGLLSLLFDYDNQYNKLLAYNNDITLMELSEEETDSITPLIVTQWGQGYPYNMYCPDNGDGGYFDAGCGAVAMAQLVNYYKVYNGQNDYSYVTKSQSKLLSMDFNSLNFDWSQMTVKLDDNSTDTQKDNVARLIYACGVAQSMDYGSIDDSGKVSGSGSHAQNIPYAFTHYFGYNANIVYKSRMFYKNDEWHAVIMAELKNNHPLIYCSSTHAFILDGLNTKGQFHFNFGWNGNFDGFYELDAIKYEILGYVFMDETEGHGIICNIDPGQGYGVQENIFYTTEFTPSLFNSILYSVDVNSVDICSFDVLCFDASATFDDNNFAKFSGEVGIGVWDNDWNFIDSLYTVGANCSVGDLVSRSYAMYRFKSEVFGNEGSYWIGLYAKSYDSDKPTIVRSLNAQSDVYYASSDGEKVILLGGSSVPKSAWPIIDSILLGDANNDKIVNVADIVHIANHIMGTPASDFNFKNADVDNDGVIDVADITLVVNIILQANPSQAPAYSNGALTGLTLNNLGNGEVSLNVPASSQYVAAQLDVVVPFGSSISDISLNAGIVASHHIVYNMIENNRYRVVVYSPNNNGFENITGDLLTIKTSGNADGVSVENVVCVTNSGMEHSYANTESHTDGIKTITIANDNHAIYTIDGREVKQQNLSRGMYIINGKKIVVK